MSGDFALLAAWRAGDGAAGAKLFDIHYEPVRRFFRNKSGEAFEDLVHKTFLARVESRDKFEQRSSFRTFLFGVANNVLRTHYRKRRVHNERFEAQAHSVHDLAPRASTLLVKRAEEEMTLQALRRLPLEDQVVLELYFWEDLRAADIAEALDMPEPTVRTRIRRARIMLEAFIKELSADDAQMTRTISGLNDWVAGIRVQLPAKQP